MKAKIIIVLLVLMISISVTGCSNSKGSSNLDNKSESTNTKLSSDDNKNSAMEAYKAVLLNNVEFYSTDNKKNVYLNDFLTNKEIYENVFEIVHFAVVDMDGDGMPEVILELKAGSNVEFYEVLHYMNNKVNGYIQVLRGFGNLKADGTVSYSDSAFSNGYRKLNFDENASEDHILGYKNTESKNNVETKTYFINNKPVTKDSYNEFIKEQDEKKDAVWYEFSKDNIETKITDNKPNSDLESNIINEDSKKQEYKDKLNKIELGFKGFNSEAATTSDMYQEEYKEYKQWDDELNEIYGVLKVQLVPSDMKKLQAEEIQWIKDRDTKAQKDSGEMAGGSMQKVLYEGSLVQSTEERCYVLVDKYMK